MAHTCSAASEVYLTAPPPARAPSATPLTRQLLTPVVSLQMVLETGLLYMSESVHVRMCKHVYMHECVCVSVHM